MAKISTIASSGCLFLQKKFETLVEEVYLEVVNTHPEIRDKFGDEGLKRTKEDVVFHLEYLKTAVCLSSRELFLDYVGWLKAYFNSINLPEEWTLETLAVMQAIIRGHDTENEASQAIDYLDSATRRFSDMSVELHSFVSDDSKLNLLAQQYLGSLLRRDRLTAEKLILHAMDEGVNIKQVYLEVFQPAQWEIGRLWQMNRISVAMEHYFTASTQFIMSRLYSHIFSSRKNGHHMVATSVSGELHELGIRMVADFFEMEGWSTVYLGANTPDSSVVDMVRETKADLLAISATIPYNLPKVTSLVDLMRKELPGPSPKIMVGGRAFAKDRDLWKRMNADAFAQDAVSAIEMASKLVN